MKPEDQMRDALREVLAYCDELGVELGSVRVFAEQALNHTPDTGEMVDHIGDANKMVRLTEEELINQYILSKAEWKATNKRQRQRIAVMFGNAVIGAMIAANK